MRRVTPLSHLLATTALLCSFALGLGEQMAFESHDGDVSVALGVGSGTSAPVPDTEGHAPGTPHACHCAHAHLLIFSAAIAPAAAPVPGRDARLTRVVRPNSIQPAPRTRPPIA